jgi:hypothetical protein
VLTATRRLQTEVPLGKERSSGSRVRFPVRITLLMFVAAIRRSNSLLCVVRDGFDDGRSSVRTGSAALGGI